MPARTVTVQLSEEQARWLDEQVAAGREDPVAEALRAEALETVLSRSDDQATHFDERWIAETVAPRLERLRTDPLSGLNVEQARRLIAAARSPRS